MAKNTGRGSRSGAVTNRAQARMTSGTWVKRDATTGRFLEVKKSGGAFKGVRKEK